MNQLNVKLVNEVSHNSLNNYYVRDLYVNPSYHEGLQNKYRSIDDKKCNLLRYKNK